MNRKEWKEWIAPGPVLLDGATGTLLQQQGMPAGACPERHALAHPDRLSAIQEAYFRAGSEIVYVFSFGGSEIKLAHHGADPDEAARLNRSLSALSVSVRDRVTAGFPGRRRLVAGDLAPTGAFLPPGGDLSFDALRGVYRRQARALADGGADLFVLETMMDLAQARAALLAVRDTGDYPVVVTLTFGPEGRTLSGNPLEACVVTLQALGADAVGANCSTGPDAMAGPFGRALAAARVPLAAKPNAGMPELKDGRAVFPMGPVDFADAMAGLVGQGVWLAGGCCGTTPDHLAALAARLSRPDGMDRGDAADRQFRLPALAPDEWLASPVLALRRPDSLDNCPVLDADGLSPDLLADGLPDEAADGRSPLVLRRSHPWTPSEAGAAAESLELSVQAPVVFQVSDPDTLASLLVRHTGRAGVLPPADAPDRLSGALESAAATYGALWMGAQRWRSDVP